MGRLFKTLLLNEPFVCGVPEKSGIKVVIAFRIFRFILIRRWETGKGFCLPSIHCFTRGYKSPPREFKAAISIEFRIDIQKKERKK